MTENITNYRRMDLVNSTLCAVLDKDFGSRFQKVLLDGIVGSTTGRDSDGAAVETRYFFAEYEKSMEET